MAFYKQKKMSGLFWNTPLRRSVFVAGLIITFLLFLITQISTFLIFRLNIVEYPISEILMVVGCLINTQIFAYIYIKKDRYGFVLSDHYKAFRLGETTGMVICALMFVFAFLGSLATAIIIDFLLNK